MEDQQRAADQRAATKSRTSRCHTQPPARPALAARRTGCGVARSPAASPISGDDRDHCRQHYRRRFHCRDLSPRCHQRSVQQRHSTTSAAKVRYGRRTWSMALAGYACDGFIAEERNLQFFFAPRGATRCSCCKTRTATLGGGMLVRSCPERTCATTRTQNVPPSADERSASTVRSRWACREWAWGSARVPATLSETSHVRRGDCHVIVWGRKKARCTVVARHLGAWLALGS
jgi:hypothetical protein